MKYPINILVNVSLLIQASASIYILGYQITPHTVRTSSLWLPKTISNTSHRRKDHLITHHYHGKVPAPFDTECMHHMISQFIPYLIIEQVNTRTTIPQPIRLYDNRYLAHKIHTNPHSCRGNPGSTGMLTYCGSNY